MWSLPLRLREFFKRVRCIFACCNSEIVIENSVIDGKPKQEEEEYEQQEELEKSVE